MSESLQDQASNAVSLVQRIVPDSIVRADQLGPFSLGEAVEPLERLVRFFGQIPIKHIRELPDQQATLLRDHANAVLDRVRDLDEFDPKTQENPSERQRVIIDALTNFYPNAFNAIWQIIAYLSSRDRDFGTLEVEARSLIENIRSDSSALQQELAIQKEAAVSIIEDIRKVAAETGVSQEAIHFSTESTNHATEAGKWEKRTVGALIAIVIFGILTIFLHRFPWIEPRNLYDTIQLAVSKVIIFVVLFYALTLCARNYLAHKHGETVNKHRQNALATYKAIADAAHDEAGRDIVLSHAADCIFSPQETGYLSQRRGEGAESAPTLQILPRIASGSDS